MTTPPPPSLGPSPLAFLPLFLLALGVRFGTVALGPWLATLPPNVLGPDDPAVLEVRDRILNGRARVIEPWYRWDAIWVVNVATHGYAAASDRGGRLGVAFMPAMPATLALGAALGVDPFWFGLIVTNVLGAAGAALLGRVAARQLNDPAAGWRALVLLLAFPTAFFCSAPYNEAFGVFFTALVLYAWQENRANLGGCAAIGGSLARLTGVAPGVAAVLDWLVTRDRSALRRAVTVAFGSFAGVFAFYGFLWWALGDPLVGLKANASWGRADLSWKNPWLALRSIGDPAVPHWGEAVVVFGAAALGVRAWRKRGTFWGLVVLVPVAQIFASGTLLSAHRVVLAALPAFIELADLLRGRRTVLFATVLIFSFAQFVLLNRYVHWQFAG